MTTQQYTVRKLINGAILIPAVFIALLATAYFEWPIWTTVLFAIGLTAIFVILVNRWQALDRPISKNAYTVWNVVIILTFVIIYYTIRSSM
ncbi:hypothetical protein MKY84_12570 [Chryseomicrobium sp. FSL W7-1435]|uniref:hypothetical protein n=1 Tax=Chryseomicrobium sp. FSL W7-1435 TaxID=2921704 RepID=UPI00315B1D95